MQLRKILSYTILISVLATTASAQNPRSSPGEPGRDHGLIGAPTAKPQRSTMNELRSKRLFTITIRLHPTVELGNTPAGKRRVFAVSGGEFEGDRIRGTILPIIGSDLLLVRADGSAQQDVRMLLQTDDQALVLMTYRGVRHASDEVNARIARGESVDPTDYYLRTAPFFETASPKYAWLNKLVAVGVGERRGADVVYEVFEVL
jgi:hypothetical protein